MPLAVILFLGYSFVAFAQSNPPDWHVRLADGTNSVVSVSAHSGQLEFRNPSGIALELPVASVTQILYMTQTYRRSTKAFNYFDQKCCPATPVTTPSQTSTVEANVLPLLAAAIMSPLGQSKNHYVEVRWFRNGEGSTVLSIDKQEYLPFLNWLTQATGLGWTDIDKERAQALDQVQKRAGEAFDVRFLSHAPRNQSFSFSNYLVLPVELHDRTHLLLFKDQVKPKNLVDILPVSRIWSDNRCVADSAVLYRGCDQDHCGVDTILLPTVSYRIDAPQPTPIDLADQNKSDCSKLHDQRTELGVASSPDPSDVRPTLKRRD
jgi:hypothetical protein